MNPKICFDDEGEICLECFENGVYVGEYWLVIKFNFGILLFVCLSAYTCGVEKEKGKAKFIN